MKEAIESGKALPTELRKEADALRAEIELDDASRGTDAANNIDSEYSNAGVSDPKVCVCWSNTGPGAAPQALQPAHPHVHPPQVLLTTSHDPSSKLTQFLKEMRLLIPNSHRMNRGGNTVERIVSTCRADGFTDIIILQEHRGVPDGLVVSHLPYGPTAYFGLHNVVMRHDLPQVAPVSEAFPHIVLHNLSTKVGLRVATILKHLFPVPKAEAKRVVSLVNRDDFISMRHHVYARDKADVNLMEAGPRFELRLYQIKLGTVEQTEVENEFVLRPYQNSAKRRKVMGE